MLVLSRLHNESIVIDARELKQLEELRESLKEVLEALHSIMQVCKPTLGSLAATEHVERVLKQARALLTPNEFDLIFRVTVVDIRGDKVRLGITAPDCVPVHRDEVFKAIEMERQAG